MLTVIDLSETLHSGTPVLVETIRDTYEDPPFYYEQWASIPTKGYSVHAIHMGTHTGTHVDAPSHFVETAVTVDMIPPNDLVGRALVMDFTGRGSITEDMISEFIGNTLDRDHIPLLISNPEEFLSHNASKLLIEHSPKLVLIACGFNEPDELYVNARLFMEAGVPLVQRVVREQARLVRDGDLIVVAPLKLLDLEGAPARALAIRISE